MKRTNLVAGAHGTHIARVLHPMYLHHAPAGRSLVPCCIRDSSATLRTTVTTDEGGMADENLEAIGRGLQS